MQNVILGKMDRLILHFVGNKNNGDGVRFSDVLTDFENIEDFFKQLIDNNFKYEELYQFFFLPNLELNPMYQFISSVFKEKESFIEQSKNVGRYLYDKSTHPQIKGGELCIFYLKDCQINDELIDCIGIFKSENKDTILKVSSTKDGYNLKDEKGINTTKLDKGCLIFNTETKNGYIVSVVDNTNKNTEAQYWKDDFLSVQPKRNEYHQTNQFLGIAKQFVTKKLTEDFEVSKADQIDLLNRSVEYFKNHETFEKTDFEKKVFQDNNTIDSFRNFDEGYRRDNEIDISNNFDISTQAVKKQARAFKSVLKLDKNFHIYIHGDKELIEQGVEKDGRKYYKIYYKDES
ncbi:MAG: nucleoid-associated protein [Vicingaceae bacterium]|nr:nucleoid-associated protein [Vicingaceae bacterium]